MIDVKCASELPLFPNTKLLNCFTFSIVTKTHTHTHTRTQRKTRAQSHKLINQTVNVI